MKCAAVGASDACICLLLDIEQQCGSVSFHKVATAGSSASSSLESDPKKAKLAQLQDEAAAAASAAEVAELEASAALLAANEVGCMYRGSE